MTEILVISRWIHFAALFILFGASFFWIHMRLSAASGGDFPRSFRATLLLLRIAVAAAIPSGLAWLAASIANMTGGFENVVDPATLQAFFFETQFGPVTMLRLALFAAAAAVAVLRLPNRVRLFAFAAVAALLLVDQAWLGHAAEGGATAYGALMIVVYATHMLAGASWVGGLVPLFLTLLETRRFDPRERRELSLALLSRFSLMGLCAVTLVLVSGAGNVAFHAVSPSKLAQSGYGEVLFAKLCLVVGMLTLAYFNRFVAMPRLAALPPKGAAHIGRLRASVGLELALGMFVVGLAALLGITPPPQ